MLINCFSFPANRVGDPLKWGILCNELAAAQQEQHALFDLQLLQLNAFDVGAGRLRSCRQNSTAFTQCWEELIHNVEVVRVIKNEQPVRMPLQPGLDSIDHTGLICIFFLCRVTGIRCPVTCRANTCRPRSSTRWRRSSPPCRSATRSSSCSKTGIGRTVRHRPRSRASVRSFRSNGCCSS